MKQIFILFLFSFTFQVAAIDVGDGSDGVCVTGTFVSTKKNYQCTSLNITGALNLFSGSGQGAGGADLVIKVQGDVTIANGATFNLSGANGIDGNTAGAIAGGAAGAGGSAGGNSTATNGANGNGTGAGTGGIFAPIPAVNPFSVGGGGGGGSYSNISITIPIIGDQDGAPIAAGTNGPVYGAEINFETSFLGGSGGAAGGTGVDNTATPAPATTWFGSSGGGGGGAIHIVAGGDITVAGTIISSGGVGGGAGGEIGSGGGGGGSGGAIWLQAAGALLVSSTGSINAAGGAGGINVSGFGTGGDGGDGRIRLDDGDGAIVIDPGGAVGPNAVSTTFVPTSASTARQYSSAVSCARVSLSEDHNFDMILNLLIGMILSSIFYFLFSKRGKV